MEKEKEKDRERERERRGEEERRREGAQMPRVSEGETRKEMFW
jgi:hypothetical protein